MTAKRISAMPRAVLYLLVAVSLSACQTIMQDIPPDDPGWVPQGINAGNISAMAAVPHDLVHGRGDLTGSGQTTAAAVVRLWEGRAKPLPVAEAAAMGDSGAAAAPAAPTAPPAGSPGGQ